MGQADEDDTVDAGRMTAPVCHIRAETTRKTLCGETGESISINFMDHVIPNKDGCCKNLWNRLCPVCFTKTKEHTRRERDR